MNIKNIIEKVRDFIDRQVQIENRVKFYEKRQMPLDFFKSLKIKVELGACKEIILQDETKLELGGAYNKSFSLIYPLHVRDFIQNGKITLIGPEIKDISDSSVDFGIFMLIGFEKISQKDFDNLRHFNFVSNGIEGFMIRTIPRRFWCRINSDVVNNFSFELLGNAIIYLYEQEYGHLIKSMEIVFINSDPDLIEEFTKITAEIREHLNEKWKDKINEWKNRIDCDYDWECEECPYIDTCEDVKEVLEERNKLQD